MLTPQIKPLGLNQPGRDSVPTRLRLLLGCLLALGLAAACDGSPDPEIDASADAAMADGGSIDAGPGESISLVIAEPLTGHCTDRSALRRLPGGARGCDSGAGEWAPIEGALVALDAPDGTRLEATSGSDGRVTLSGVHWSAGDHALTVYADDHIMNSWLVVNEAWLGQIPLVDGDPGIWMIPLTGESPPASITVTGSATGLVDASHPYTVNTLETMMGGSEWQGASSAPFSVTAPSGAPFILQGIEAEFVGLPSGQGHAATVYRVAHQPMDAATSDVTGVTLDFAANEIPTHTASYALVLPTRAASPHRASRPLAFVVHKGTSYAFGWAQTLDISADGNQFDITSVWVEPTFADNPHTLFRMMEAPAFRRQIGTVIVPGYPVEGMTVPVPFDVPAVSAVDMHSRVDPLEVEWRDADVPATGVAVIRDGTQVWAIRAGPNATTMNIPAPPTGVDVTAFLSEFPLFFVWGAEDYPDGILKRRVNSPELLLVL